MPTPKKITELDAITTPVDADLMPVVIEVSTTPLSKKITWANIKATLKAYFDGLYATIAGLAGKNSLHGVVARPVGATNPLPTAITTTTFTLGATANPIQYYYKGTLVTVSADKTTVLADGAGLYYIYFDAATGNLLNAKGIPVFTSDENITIASVLWNGSDYGLVSDERHSSNRNKPWHSWAHNTIGCRYRSGITLTHNGGTGAAATFATTSGELADEDIQFVILASSAFPTANTCRLLWQASASAYSFNKVASAIPGYLGANNRPNYVKASDYSVVEMTSAVNRYINVFVYATTDIHTPIYMVTESVSDTVASANGHTNLANVRAVPFPNLSGFGLSPEMKPIYRLIWRADGVLQAIDTAQDDYRNVSSLPSAAGNVSTTASAVTYNASGEVTNTTVQTAIDQLGTNKVGRRVYSAASTATLTPEVSTYDIFELTAQGEALTIANHSTSAPADGQRMKFRLKCDGTLRTVSFGNYYRGINAVLPDTLRVGETLYLEFAWNLADTKWDYIKVQGEKEIQIKVVDDATALTTGDGKIIFVIPASMNGMNLIGVASMVSTVSSSGTPEVQIRNVTDSQDMLSTKLTIDASEFTSYTAATPAVINASYDDVATGDRIAIDVDTAGTGAKGLTVYLRFKLP